MDSIAEWLIRRDSRLHIPIPVTFSPIPCLVRIKDYWALDPECTFPSSRSCSPLAINFNPTACEWFRTADRSVRRSCEADGDRSAHLQESSSPPDHFHP